MCSKTVILVASSTSTNSRIPLDAVVIGQLTLRRSSRRRGFAKSVFPLKFDLRYHNHDHHDTTALNTSPLAQMT